MRKLSLAIVFVVLAVALAVVVSSHTPAGKRVYGYTERRSIGTNEAECFFLVGDFKRGLHMGPCGIGEAVNLKILSEMERSISRNGPNAAARGVDGLTNGPLRETRGV